jgi:hypothetical protein
MAKFEITLKAQKSVLNNIECYEPINIDYLDKLIHSDLLKLNFHNPFASYKWCNEREQLIAYKKLYNEKTKMCTVKYEKVKEIKETKKDKKSKKDKDENKDKDDKKEYIPFGRVNPNNALGLFNIRRELRQTLCKDYLIDLDIDNAHPSILLQICNMYNEDADKLEEYVDNRDKKLKQVMEDYKCSRDEAKTLFIILLYFGSFDTWVSSNKIGHTEDGEFIEYKPNKFCEKFKKELGEIGHGIMEKNKEIVEFVEKRKGEKGYNKVGSVVSFYLQEIENRILETMYTYCVKNKYIVNNVCVLCADGLMIEKDRYKPSLLKEFSKVVKDKFGFDLNFSVKEMKQDYIDILDKHILTEEQYQIEFLGGYDAKIEYDKNTKFDVYKLTEYFNEDVEELGNEKYINHFHLTKSFKYFNSYHSFFYQSASIYKIHNTTIDTYKNLDITFDDLIVKDDDGKKITKFTTLYNECQQKIKYSKFCFEPNKKVKDDEYNLFTGFKYDTGDYKYNMDDIQIYIDHIKYLTNNDEDATNYIINWICHIIQKPQQKTRVAIILYSQTEQVGKNLLLDILNDLFTGYANKIKDTFALTDRFNGDMMGKLFVVGDEINARAQDICNELKDIITRETEVIEFKNKDKIFVNDYKNYVMTTNNENVFKISNSDKRFLFVECPDKRKEQVYYDKLVEFKNDKNKIKQLFNYFKTKDISTFQPIKIVTTEYKKHLILNNLPAYFRFIKEEYDLLNNDESIPIDVLYKMSIDYARKNRLQSTYTDRLFSQQMHKVFGQFKIIKNRKVEYKFPANNGLKDDKLLEGVDYIKKILEESLITN